jgi:hypothetical protein
MHVVDLWIYPPTSPHTTSTIRHPFSQSISLNLSLKNVYNIEHTHTTPSSTHLYSDNGIRRRGFCYFIMGDFLL